MNLMATVAYEILSPKSAALISEPGETTPHYDQPTAAPQRDVVGGP